MTGSGFVFGFQLLRTMRAASPSAVRTAFSPARQRWFAVSAPSVSASPSVVSVKLPEAVTLPETADEAAEALWQGLDANNRISLYVCYTDRRSGETRERIINRYEKV